MEVGEFKDFAKEMVDYIGNYLENIRERLVIYYVRLNCLSKFSIEKKRDMILQKPRVFQRE